MAAKKSRAEAARAKQSDRNIASLSGNRLYGLAGLLRSEIALEFCQQRRKIVAALPQISSQCAHGRKVTARSASESQIDTSRKERFERAELLGHNERRMIGQHHSATAHANRL